MSAAAIAAVLGEARREGRVWRCRCPLHGGWIASATIAERAALFTAIAMALLEAAR
jgi:hypothetical protein